MEDEFFGGGGYGVRYVAQTTRLVGPEPQVLVTGADVLDAMLLPCVWPVSFNHGFARTVTAEIFAELNRELPELRALARTQFGYESLGTARHETQSPLVRRYITALHREERGAASVFYKLPVRRLEPDSDDEEQPEAEDSGSSDDESTGEEGEETEWDSDGSSDSEDTD